MRFLSLTVENFGVFRGEHFFDLTPENSNNLPRNLILFRGHNGSGKSTIFQAIKLALHGRFILGDRISHQEYNEYILSRLHWSNDGSEKIVSNAGAINLCLEYVQSGSSLVIQIYRKWKRSRTSISETLSVLVDGNIPDIREEDYQFWLNDLFPPGIIPISFYDAEQLETLSNPAKQPDGLISLISRLSGLDLVERLKKDINYYLHRQRGGQKIDRLREKVLQFQTALDDIDTNLEQLQEDSKYWYEKQKDLEKTLILAEQNLASEGGTYAARRPILKERLTVLDAEIEMTSDQLRDLSTQLLPFALAPELCQQLSQQLTYENEVYRQQVADELWHKRIGDLEDALLEDSLWQGIQTNKKAGLSIIQRLFSIIASNGHEERKELVHHLAEPEQEQLQQWVLQALHSVPPQVEFLGKSLCESREEQQRTRDELNRAPDNEVLTPIYEEIAKFESAILEVKEQQKGLQSQIGALNFKRDDTSRQFHRAGDELRAAQANERKLDLAERSKLVLGSYQDALTRQRLATLEKSLVDSFNAICRKEHLLESVEFDPDAFTLTLLGKNNQTLNLNDFSAGESQLFAMALLRALRQISQHKLPLTVDAPLARLDEVHRDRLVSDFFPVVSDQVILFVTDTEMDDHIIERAGDSIARIYHLSFDPVEQMSTVDPKNEFSSATLVDP